MIWNWNWNGNTGHEIEAQVALKLMRVSDPSITATQQEDYARANALYDMASLALHCQRYDDASKILNSAALGSTAVHVLEHQLTRKVQEQYAKIEQYARRYHKALRLLPAWLNAKHRWWCRNREESMPKESSPIPDGVAWHCCAVLVNLYSWGCATRKIRYPGPILDWSMYAAKALIHTIDA
jgi:hypothetical protein